MSKSSTSVNRKALKLDNKVKAINHCDVGKIVGLWARRWVLIYFVTPLDFWYI
jgi:hypothetical protein